MSEQITAEQIDELKANGYIVSTGLLSGTAWYAVPSQRPTIDAPSFAAAARAAWEHYQASKRPARPSNVPEHAEWRLPRAGDTYMDSFGFTNRATADWSIVKSGHNSQRWCWRDEPQRPPRPQYPSGYAEWFGKGYQIKDGSFEYVGERWIMELIGFGFVECANAKPCPPRPEPKDGWKPSGVVKDTFKGGESYFTKEGLSVATVKNDIDNQPNKSLVQGLRWEAVRDTPQVYDAATFPKGEVWVRFNTGGLSRALVIWIGATSVHVVNAVIGYQDLADHYELSTDGGRTWRPARPE